MNNLGKINYGKSDMKKFLFFHKSVATHLATKDDIEREIEKVEEKIIDEACDEFFRLLQNGYGIEELLEKFKGIIPPKKIDTIIFKYEINKKFNDDIFIQKFLDWYEDRY